jgi:hypothetical protein
MDSRASSAYWVDFSKPGEPPKYDAPNPNVDEGTSDVTDEMHAGAPADPTTQTQQNGGLQTSPQVSGSAATPPNPLVP